MTSRFFAAALVLMLVFTTIACRQDTGAYEIALLSDLEDKVRGGWAGQMIGVSFGCGERSCVKFHCLGEYTLRVIIILGVVKMCRKIFGTPQGSRNDIEHL